MNQTFVLHIAREAIIAVLALAGPAMFIALIVGLFISILQATTQIQDQMLNMVPKILVIFLTILLMGAWMLKFVTNFAINIFNQIPIILR
ncbi:MAG: flagellar biosynthesis protein FliQ [Peptococcaceae bacterium]|nr:flagellar biosynthesis protein FliQ [Peptococcaceae bacterium]